MDQQNVNQHLAIDRIATLDGVVIGDFEPIATTLVFHFVAEAGERFELDLHAILRALLFCCNQGAIPALPNDWVIQAAGIHGKVFQEDA